MKYFDEYLDLLQRYECSDLINGCLTIEQISIIEKDLAIRFPFALRSALHLLGKNLGLISIAGFGQDDMHAFFLKMHDSFIKELKYRQSSPRYPAKEKIDAEQKEKLISENRIIIFNRSCYDDLFFYVYSDNEDPAVFFEGSNNSPHHECFTDFLVFGLHDLFKSKIRTLERRLQPQRKERRGRLKTNTNYKKTLVQLEKYQKIAAEDGILL